MTIERTPDEQTIGRQATWDTGALFGEIDLITSGDLINAGEDGTHPTGEDFATGKKVSSDWAIQVMAANKTDVAKLVALYETRTSTGKLFGTIVQHYGESGAPTESIVIERAYVKQIGEAATDLDGSESARFSATVSVFNPTRMPGT